MANFNKRKTVNYLFYLVLLLSFFAYIYISYSDNTHNPINLSKDELKGLKITYFDVGQADAILIQTDDDNMLIDAGNNSDGNGIVDYLKNQDIKNFKYVVGTHAHEDHIGGMDDIINNFNIEHFYMPDVITTTKTFEEVLDALGNKSIKFETPNIDDTFKLGDATVKVIYVGNDDKNLNNSSIVIKLKYKNAEFLFMGDLEKSIEKQLLDKDIKADIIKVGHHGSDSSSSKEFIEKVKPAMAIISVGKGNKYGHPKNSTIEAFNKMNSRVLRTDELGTIIVTSDGYKVNYYNIRTNIDGK